MNEHAQNKRLVAAFLAEIAAAEPAEIGRILRTYCHPNTVWEMGHPFNRIRGNDSAAEQFWEPLKASFPDYELRMAFVLGGAYEGRSWVSTLGHVMGSFDRPWLGIPPTHGLCFLRFGMNAVVADGRIIKAYVLLDIVDLMRQAGCYPFRKMPGSAEQWPGPPCSSGADVDSYDGELGATTIGIVREMQASLPSGKTLAEHAAGARHSPHWHPHMNWYGVAGIGSSRGRRGYLDYHGALFIQAFPDRGGYGRAPDGPEDQPGHYIQIGDGHFAVTGGWPSLHGTHTGGGWLGMPPTGRTVTMRVADWYRTDAQHLIIDNWVMIDILDILYQVGLDVLDDLRYVVDPTLPRWPR